MLLFMASAIINYALFREPHSATHALLVFIALNTLDLDPFKEKGQK